MSKKVTINCMTSSLQAPGPPQGGLCFNRDFWEGAEQRQGGLTCLEWDFGSGGLKKESGSFLILMGTDGGTLLFGFIAALKSASRSVSESPRTWTIWCPAGGLCWLGSIVPNLNAKLSKCAKLPSSQMSQTVKFEQLPNCFFPHTQMEISDFQRVLVKSVPCHPKVEQSDTFFPFKVLTIETSSRRQRFLTVSCQHICDLKTDIYIPPNTNVMFIAMAPTFPNGKKSGKKSRRSQKKK